MPGSVQRQFLTPEIKRFKTATMKHLTKEIHNHGRKIAARVLNKSGEFDIHMGELTSSYFVEAIYKGDGPEKLVALKILVKASSTPFDNNIARCFQMDAEVVEKIEDFKGVNKKRDVIIVLVDTFTGNVSYEYYDRLFDRYILYGIDFPVREPSKSQGPIFWNAVDQLHYRGDMSSSERDHLIVLRTKNKADKNQKSIFDK